MAGESAKSGPSGAYAESDFVVVADANGVVQPDPVPKSWIGTPLLPEGHKQATKAQAAELDQQNGDTPA